MIRDRLSLLRSLSATHSLELRDCDHLSDLPTTRQIFNAFSMLSGMYVTEKTRFKSWDEMQSKAGQEYVERRLVIEKIR
jgi:hypothetical protein